MSSLNIYPKDNYAGSFTTQNPAVDLVIKSTPSARGVFYSTGLQGAIYITVTNLVVLSGRIDKIIAYYRKYNKVTNTWTAYSTLDILQTVTPTNGVPQILNFNITDSSIKINDGDYGSPASPPLYQIYLEFYNHNKLGTYS